MESDAICRHILAWDGFSTCRCFGAYMPMPYEADILPVLKSGWRMGKTVCLPRVSSPHTMDFCCVISVAELITWSPAPGITVLQPKDESIIYVPDLLDLLLVPLAGVDALGTRLGKGAGYYDRYFATCHGIRLGVALSYQLVDEPLPRAPWDIPLDGVVTEHGIRWYDKAIVEQNSF